MYLQEGGGDHILGRGKGKWKVVKGDKCMRFLCHLVSDPLSIVVGCARGEVDGFVTRVVVVVVFVIFVLDIFIPCIFGVVLIVGSGSSIVDVGIIAGCVVSFVVACVIIGFVVGLLCGGVASIESP